MRNLLNIVKNLNEGLEEDAPRLPLRKGTMRNARGNYAAFVCVMNPKDFVRLTTTDEQEYNQVFKDKFTDITNYRSGTDDRFNKDQYNAPWLSVEYPSGKVIGHEGRHRAAMVAKEGGMRFPCTIIFEHPRRFFLSYNRTPFGDAGDFDHDNEERITVEHPFEKWSEAEAYWNQLKKVQADHEQELTYYVSDHKIETDGGGPMKGSPRSKGWDYDAWRLTDVPQQFVGQYDTSIVVPISAMKFGKIKGYDHFTS